MTKLLHIKIFILVILITLVKVDLYAQTVLSPAEDVCTGELKQYKVEGSAGSTIYWSVEGGAVYNGGSPVIDQDLVTPGFQYSELIVSGESLIGILWNVTAGDYLVRAFEETAGSCVSANMDLTVTVSNLPDQSLTLNNPAVCPGGTASITLTNSESGVNYQLRLDSDDSDVGTAIAGTGGNITFDVNPLVTTVYNVYAENLVSTCGVELDNKSTVTVEDVIDPVAVCKDITIQLDASGNASITAAQIDNGSSDNCGIASMSLSKTDFNCDDVSTNQVVASSNGYSVNIKVWPISVNPVGTTCDSGYGYTVTLGYDISFSGSGIPAGLNTLQGTLDCGGFFSLPNSGGSGTVETANAWRGASDCATITPEILGCTDATIVINGPGIPNQNISLPLSSPNTVELTVVDNSGNTSICSANVFVEDNEAPTIETLNGISVNADAGVCTYASSQLTAPTSNDNCSVSSVVVSPASLVLGANTVTWTVTDGAGNTNTSAQVVTVIDNEDPTITAPANVTANSDGDSCTASSVALGTPTTADNCGVATVTNDAPATFPLGETTVIWTVTDNAGLTATTTQVVTVTDNTPPELPSLSADYYKGDDFQTFIQTLIVDTLNYSWGSGAPESTLVGTDDFSVRFYGSVRATQAGDYTFYTNSDDCVRLWVDGQLIIDNWPKHALVVDEGTITLTAGQVVPIVLEYSEHSGNAIIKLEWEGPGISRQFMTAIQAVTVDVTASGSYNLTVDEVDPGYTDACGIATRTLSKTNFTCSDLGVNPVTLTVTDVNGNSSSCEINVIVEDTTPPVIPTLADVTGECSATAVAPTT
ncbi:hypothetical protein BZG01_17295, partial [Labilibaculum manganireducens]